MPCGSTRLEQELAVGEMWFIQKLPGNSGGVRAGPPKRALRVSAEAMRL